MKLKRITPLIALVIAAILCFTSCSGSNKTTVTELNNGERLDLDYIENGNTSQAEPEATDAQFAGSSSVPAHVEMMGLIGMGNNPMVGATVAVAVACEEALAK